MKSAFVSGERTGESRQYGEQDENLFFFFFGGGGGWNKHISRGTRGQLPQQTGPQISSIITITLYK